MPSESKKREGGNGKSEIVERVATLEGEGRERGILIPRLFEREEEGKGKEREGGKVREGGNERLVDKGEGPLPGGTGSGAGSVGIIDGVWGGFGDKGNGRLEVEKEDEDEIKDELRLGADGGNKSGFN